MGFLRQHLHDESILKKRLLVEMIARTARHVINEKLRVKMKEIKTPSQQVFFQIM